ncbi:hypothetical protein [Methylobacterium sp. Leaf106]|uniref:hypothetical protein n=1 Tax=Methylobacterium sp. Leaf106 TaxID=1736255 RepID=UPI0006F23E6B|nr:hypothetical protein [Methylobacterium sp. Leaf106]KQP51658.1 hypothetical protein ASF34_19310 [Methylobacterium sp. Leaf106]
MMPQKRWGLVILLVIAASKAASAGDASPRDVVACDTLVQLRVLMGRTPSDPAAASADLSGHPGCRRIARDRVGAPEHRAMIGGAPFECLAVTGEASCFWIMP